ncbi:MAG: MBL fold metallo-hydrolase, partial [Acidobacteria bacterium]|nr:MBL fold metallo-hydrolase [Acidobacteriota bacterium]
MATMERISENLYRFTDTCNVYVVKDGASALLIDAGSGAVLDSLAEIGCTRVEWVLHTHHHRDQCWGDPRLIEAGARLAVPQYERHLFEKAELFWQTRRVYDNYDDRNNFLTVAQDLPVSATLNDYEEFAWR